MKIRIESADKVTTIPVPDFLISPKLIPFLVEKLGRKHAPEAMERIPPEMLEQIFRELRNKKKKYGAWELVDIQSSNGDRIHITL